METKQYAKYPKRQLLKLAVDRGLTTWDAGNRMQRDDILAMLAGPETQR